MPNLAFGNMSWTAWANTWAVECRMTLRPSSVLAATGVTSTSCAGIQLKSRSLPSASRTTPIASGAPRPGRPASRTAAAAVVPAATRIGAAGTGCARAVIDAVSMAFGCSNGPDHAIGMASTPPRPTVRSLGLAGFEQHKQRLALSQHLFAVAQPARHEDLASLHPVDSGVDLQLLLDRDDLAVIDMQVCGALAWAAGDHPRRHTQDRVEQQPERAAVHGAVASEVKPAKTGPALDAALVGSAHLHRHRQDVAAVRQGHAAARRRRPLVDVEGAEQVRHLLDQVGRLADHLVGRVYRPGVILQGTHRFDEPAVVGPASGRGVGRIESAARG